MTFAEARTRLIRVNTTPYQGVHANVWSPDGGTSYNVRAADHRIGALPVLGGTEYTTTAAFDAVYAAP